MARKSLLHRLKCATPSQARRMLAAAGGFQLHSCWISPDSAIPQEIKDLYHRERDARRFRNTSVQDARGSINLAGPDSLPGLRLALMRERRGGRRATLIAALQRRIRDLETAS